MLQCPTQVNRGCDFTEDVRVGMIFLGGQFWNLVILSRGAQWRASCERWVIGNQYQYQSLGPVWDIWPWRDTYRAMCQERMNVTHVWWSNCVVCPLQFNVWWIEGQMCKQVKVPICFLRVNSLCDSDTWSRVSVMKVSIHFMTRPLSTQSALQTTL